MRAPSIHSRERGELEIKMTPMIDVVFLLLVFFVWTASFQIVEQILPSNLTAAAGTEASDDADPPPDDDFDDVIIHIHWRQGAPVWQINDVTLATLDELRERLGVIVNVQRDKPVILHPHPDVAFGHVVDAYDVAKVAGFERVQYAASEKI